MHAAKLCCGDVGHKSIRSPLYLSRCVCAVIPDTWCVVCVCVQKQPLLHMQSKGKGKADAPPTNGNSEPAANGSEAEDAEDQGESSKDRGEHWPAVQAAEANEPVGIITIEDVLEELIGQVWLLYCPCCVCLYCLQACQAIVVTAGRGLVLLY